MTRDRHSFFWVPVIAQGADKKPVPVEFTFQ